MIKKLVVSILLISLVLVVSGCIAAQNTKENVEAVAQKFSVELQNSNWEDLYDLFTPELKAMRNKEDFVKYISIKGSPLESNYLIFDKVVMQGDNEAYAYYTFSTGVLESKIPPMHLVFTTEGWRVDAFISYFMGDASLQIYGTQIANIAVDMLTSGRELTSVIDYITDPTRMNTLRGNIAILNRIIEKVPEIQQDYERYKEHLRSIEPYPELEDVHSHMFLSIDYFMDSMDIILKWANDGMDDDSMMSTAIQNVKLAINETECAHDLLEDYIFRH